MKVPQGVTLAAQFLLDREREGTGESIALSFGEGAGAAPCSGVRAPQGSKAGKGAAGMALGHGPKWRGRWEVLV